jgi:DNA-binding protein H-NS
MATKSYTQLMSQIKSLEAQAEALRSKEKGEVIVRIRSAIDAYQLSPQDLFGGKAKGAGKKVTRKRGKATAKYSDGSGNVWGGRGPRPRWLREALASGKQLSDFLAPSGSDGRAATKKSRAVRTVPASQSKSYADGKGNTWSGRGKRPNWFKEALAAGKTKEQLAAVD